MLLQLHTCICVLPVISSASPHASILPNTMYLRAVLVRLYRIAAFSIDLCDGVMNASLKFADDVKHASYVASQEEAKVLPSAFQKKIDWSRVCI